MIWAPHIGTHHTSVTTVTTVDGNNTESYKHKHGKTNFKIQIFTFYRNIVVILL